MLIPYCTSYKTKHKNSIFSTVDDFGKIRSNEPPQDYKIFKLKFSQNEGSGVIRKIDIAGLNQICLLYRMIQKLFYTSNIIYKSHCEVTYKV